MSALPAPQDVDLFVSRLTKAMREINKRKKRKQLKDKMGAQSKPVSDAKVADFDQRMAAGAEQSASAASAAT